MNKKIYSKKDIWQMLIEGGLSPYAAAAVMGNMEAESGICASRLQGDFTSGFTRSAEYVEAVDAGNISRDDFVYHGPNGGGFGLLQWTFWTRKAGLFDTCKKKGVSISDAAAQVEWFFIELSQPEYKKVLDALKEASSIRACSDILVTDFLRPADQSLAVKEYRGKLGTAIFEELSETPGEPEKVQNCILITEKEYENFSKAAMVVMYLKDLLNMLNGFDDDFHP